MASNTGLLAVAGIALSAEFIMKLICCMVFALVLVMLFHFVLASHRSRIAKTEKSEILESVMSYYTNSEPYPTLEPYGVVHERIEIDQ